MTDDASLPSWARDRRTFTQGSGTLGAGLTVTLVAAAIAAPSTLRSLVDGAFWLVIGLLVAGAMVGAVRGVILGSAETPVNALVATSLLAYVPFCITALSIAAMVALSFAFQWPARYDLVHSLLLLLFGFLAFRIAVKIFVNAQMLVRHWLSS